MRFLAALLALLPLAVQEPSIEELLRRLESEDIAVREQATSDLAARGPAALPALEAASKKLGAETASRLRPVIRRLRAQRWSRAVLASVDNSLSPFGRADHFQTTPDGKTAVGS